MRRWRQVPERRSRSGAQNVPGSRPEPPPHPHPTSKQAHTLTCSGLLKIYYFNGESVLKDDKTHFSSSRKEPCPVDRSPTQPDSQADGAQASPPLPWDLKDEGLVGGSSGQSLPPPQPGSSGLSVQDDVSFAGGKGPPTPRSSACADLREIEVLRGYGDGTGA